MVQLLIKRLQKKNNSPGTIISSSHRRTEKNMTRIIAKAREAPVIYVGIILFNMFLIAVYLEQRHNEIIMNNSYRNDVPETVQIKSSGINKKCLVSFGKYDGNVYRHPYQTVGNGKCLVENKWMQVVQHSVKQDQSQEIINDWLFINYHDRINVLVQDPNKSSDNEKNDDDMRFLVFQQTKYALEGRQSLAIVGGIIEPNESPKQAAIREVNEEMNGLICDNFVELGRFRTDVNRGMGWVHSFLARDCFSDQHLLDNNKKKDNQDEVGKEDSERQEVISMKLSEIRQRILLGEFLEVQWSNTVALALLHLDSTKI